MKIVATTSLPSVDRPNADRWNAAHSRQKNAHAGIAYSACTIPPLQHFYTFPQILLSQDLLLLRPLNVQKALRNVITQK